MRRSSRAIASLVVLSLSLSACGGHSTPFSSLPNTLQSSDSRQSLQATSASTPLISIPKTWGKLAYTDVGRRPSNAPVNVAITLRYNHQSELEQFIAAQSAPGGAHQLAHTPTV